MKVPLSSPFTIEQDKIMTTQTKTDSSQDTTVLLVALVLALAGGFAISHFLREYFGWWCLALAFVWGFSCQSIVRMFIR